MSYSCSSPSLSTLIPSVSHGHSVCLPIHFRRQGHSVCLPVHFRGLDTLYVYHSTSEACTIYVSTNKFRRREHFSVYQSLRRHGHFIFLQTHLVDIDTLSGYLLTSEEWTLDNLSVYQSTTEAWTDPTLCLSTCPLRRHGHSVRLPVHFGRHGHSVCLPVHLGGMAILSVYLSTSEAWTLCLSTSPPRRH